MAEGDGKIRVAVNGCEVIGKCMANTVTVQDDMMLVAIANLTGDREGSAAPREDGRPAAPLCGDLARTLGLCTARRGESKLPGRALPGSRVSVVAGAGFAEERTIRKCG